MTLEAAIYTINKELDQLNNGRVTAIRCYIASHLFTEIVEGVHYLHSQTPPIIHRDLKPENIFISDSRDENSIKIGDFGLAVRHANRVIEDGYYEKNATKVHTQKVGTYGYYAPEVLKGSQYNEKCDLYSLGAIMMDLFGIDKELRNEYKTR
jgi:serine/threonine protein kinase